MRRFIVGLLTGLLLTLAIVAVHQIALAQSAAQPAAPGTYYQTYRGLDFRSLDSNDVVYWATGTGGGVWFNSHARAGVSSYLEAHVDLPSGAQVTAVTFYVRACDATFKPKLYFGAYAPASNGYVDIIPQFAPPTGACAQTLTITQPVDPPLTIDNAAQVYVIGYTPGAYYMTDTYSNFVMELLVGARVTYQMPGAFLPYIQR
jgi:hypothetical protein